MTFHVRHPERQACEVMAEVLRPAPPLDLVAYAKKNIVFGPDDPFEGPYNEELFPELSEILAALSPEDPCRIVTFVKAAQIGGTIAANIFTLACQELDPGALLWVHPTIENAIRWSRTKLAPMLRATSSLSPLFPQKSRDGSDSILYKERVDGRGSITISGANSPASLSMISMRRQVQDDLSKWEQSKSAGDPEIMADSRSSAFEFAKIVKISTPLVMPGCRITRSYREGSQERPWVPCPHAECGEHQVLEWPNLQVQIEADPDDPHFTCVHCGGEIREHQLPAMKRRLEWRADNPKARPYHRSFWLWKAYSALSSWARIARAWMSAKGDPAKEQGFYNDTLGLAYEAAGEAPPWEKLRDRASESPTPRGRIPAGFPILAMGLDCQADRVEAQVVAFGREGRRHIVEYLVVPGHISDPTTRGRLDDVLKQKWPNAAGRRIGLDKVAIDGNAWTEDVWDWSKRHPASLVIMVRGVASDSAPLLAKVKKERNTKTGKLLRYSSRFYNFGTSVLKMSLYRNLAKEDPLDRGFVGFPTGLDDEYFRQLTAERRQAKKNRSGFTVYQWVKDPNQANEALDTLLQAEAAAIRLGIRSFADATWDRFEAERETPEAAAQLDLEDLPLLQAQKPPPAAALPAQANAVRPAGGPKKPKLSDRLA